MVHEGGRSPHLPLCHLELLLASSEAVEQLLVLCRELDHLSLKSLVLPSRALQGRQAELTMGRGDDATVKWQADGALHIRGACG